MKPKKIILVPYKFQEKSKVALDNAIQIASYLKAEIHLLTVIPSGPFFSELLKNDKENRQIAREMAGKLREVIQDVKAKCGLRFTYSVEKGNPEEIILETAEALKAIYIVMGKKTIDSSKFFFFNNRNIPILTKASCPVFMTGSEPISNNGFKNIVLPLDLNKQNLEKTKKAIEWAKFYDATIHLVGILTSNIPSKQSLLHAKMEKAYALVERAKIKCTKEIYPKSKISIEEQILQHVTKVQGDLIIIMTHREVGALDTYIGKTAQGIILNSNVPVVSYTSAAMATREHFMASLIPFEIFSAQNENLKKKI